jgi:1-aminocyclopropane-1-carboxylate deaminase/D-cysteine desulfhydrase-like pyridoxal-dependent ACC family enzyme
MEAEEEPSVPHTRTELAHAVASQPRFAVASLPTPLVHAPRFSAAVGGDMWLKRDDLTGLALGGNKARKIEYIFGAAVRDGGIDTVVTVGAAQSNHARTVAAAARVAGWECHLVLGGHRPARPTGNLVLDVALGADLHFAGVNNWDELETAASAVADELTAKGRRVVTIPMGGSTAAGALGFVAAYLELLDQLDSFNITPAVIVHATASGGTQAGLDYAHRVLGSGPEIVGVGVAKSQAELTRDVVGIEKGLVALLGLEPGASDPVVLGGYMGEAYGIPTRGGQSAMQLLASTEAVLTDSVYTAKALHAAADFAGAKDGPLVFWHTGGIPALFSDSVGIGEWDVRQHNGF